MMALPLGWALIFLSMVLSLELCEANILSTPMAIIVGTVGILIGSILMFYGVYEEIKQRSK
jgi:hypothetical protein